jgi:hypothetical protein
MLYRIDGYDYWYPMNGAFDSAGTLSRANAAADGWYDDLTQMTTYTGRFGKGLCFGTRGSSFGTGMAEAVGKRFQSGETCVIGQAIFQPREDTRWWAFGVGDFQGIGTGNSYSNRHFWLDFEDGGLIRLYVGGTSTTNPGGQTLVATSAAKVWHGDQWNYIECRFKLSTGGAGLVEVRVNTVTVISYVGRTANLFTPLLGLPVGWDFLHYAGSSATPLFMVDDRYILDDTGLNNTSYLGNVRVNCQLTSAAGDLTEMSVFGAAANWDAVNEPILNDVEYVYTPTMGQRDLYTMNPNVTAQNILGVQVTGAHRQDDSTQLKSNLLMKTGGLLSTGPDHFLSQNYTYYHDMYELNPQTGVGWTAANLNALQAGQKVQLG